MRNRKQTEKLTIEGIHVLNDSMQDNQEFRCEAPCSFWSSERLNFYCTRIMAADETDTMEDCNREEGAKVINLRIRQLTGVWDRHEVEISDNATVKQLLTCGLVFKLAPCSWRRNLLHLAVFLH